MSYKAGYIGIIGNPNSGKSTLLNALIGEKISIVTGKPQTTRKRITGIMTTENFQSVFVDTPGVVHSTSGLNNFLQEEYKDVLKQSDGLIAALNIDEKSEERIDQVIELVASTRKPWFAVITKTDLSPTHRIVKIKEKLIRYNVPVVVVSALKEPKLCRQQVSEHLAALLPESPAALFPEEVYTTSTVREMCEEFIREQCFENLYQEVPFSTAVRVTQFDEVSSPTVKIMAEILLSKDNHRAMVIGREGMMLKKIGTAARQSIENLLGKKVYLQLQVTARKQWMSNPRLLEELGYVVQNPS